MRITGGEFCGRKLHAPAGRLVRPTSDRVRKSMFDLLGPGTQGQLVLDLFAGTGALGIEALSRGYHKAFFVENSRLALETLERNLENCKLAGRSTLINMEVGRYLAGGPQQPFSLILADPPYRLGWPQKLLDAIGMGGWLEPSGFFLMECESGWQPAKKAGCLGLWKYRQYGMTAVALYRQTIGDSPCRIV